MNEQFPSFDLPRIRADQNVIIFMADAGEEQELAEVISNFLKTHKPIHVNAWSRGITHLVMIIWE